MSLHSCHCADFIHDKKTVQWQNKTTLTLSLKIIQQEPDCQIMKEIYKISYTFDTLLGVADSEAEFILFCDAISVLLFP